MPEPARFLVVGGTGAALYFVGSLILYELGLSTPIASLVSYCGLVPIMYMAQRVLTFRSSEPVVQSFLKYTATQIASLVTAYLLPLLIVRHTAPPPSITFGLVLVVTASLNFLLLKFWAFRPSP